MPNRTYRGDDRGEDRLPPARAPVTCIPFRICTSGPHIRFPSTRHNVTCDDRRHMTYPVWIAFFDPGLLAQPVLFEKFKRIQDVGDVQQIHVSSDGRVCTARYRQE